MFKCVNKWNEFNDLDGYCMGEPDFIAPVTFANVDAEHKFPQYSKCKCNEKECLKYQSWLDVCKQRQGFIDWLNKPENERICHTSK